MNLLRVGRIIINLDHVIEIIPGEAAGPHPESLIVILAEGRKQTFTGDDAEGLRVFLARTVKNATVPQKDFEVT